MVYLIATAIVAGLIALDVLTGAFRALSQGTFSSKIMHKGFYKKGALVFFLIALILSEYLIKLTGVDLSLPFGFIGGSGYIAAMELSSIFENIGVLNQKQTGDEDVKDG